MYAILGRASLDEDRLDDLIATITSLIVPIMRAQAGHVNTYVCRGSDGTSGIAMSVFETKAQAEATAAAMVLPPAASLRVESIEILEVVASA